jgi:hypothetical protein
MRKRTFIRTRIILAILTAALFVLAGCGDGAGGSDIPPPVSLRPLIDDALTLAAGSGTQASPTVVSLPGGTYVITENDRISLTDQHIHLKVTAGETATIQVTQALTGSAFFLDSGTLILGGGSGGSGDLIIDGGKGSGITSGWPLICAVANLNGSYVEINPGVTLQNNAAALQEGGAVYSVGSLGKISTVKINGGVIRGNSAPGGGGIIVSTYSKLEMSEGIIEYNEANGDFFPAGGGIGSWHGGDRSIPASWPVITISGGVIRYNEAAGEGGGIYSHAATTISGTARIQDNTAGTSGGGIFRNINHAGSTLSFNPGPSSQFVHDNTAPIDADIANP